MYKVFFNHKPIYLTSSRKINTDSTPLFHIKYSAKNFILKALKSSKIKAVYLYHKDEEKLWKHFVKHFPVVQAAGGLVKHSNERILMIFRNGKWDLPKGRIEKKEFILDAAIREVTEETGVTNLIILKPLPITYHIFARKGKHRLKKTYWFLMKTDFRGGLQPQLEEGIKKAEWKSKEEISQLLDNAYENIKIHFEQKGVLS